MIDLIYVFNLDKADTYIKPYRRKNVFILNINSEMDLETVVKKI